VKSRARVVGLPETRDIFDRYPNGTNGGLHGVLARHFLKQIASALQYLRKYNPIHRDVKPQNLLLNPPPAYIQQHTSRSPVSWRRFPVTVPSCATTSTSPTRPPSQALLIKRPSTLRSTPLLPIPTEELTCENNQTSLVTVEADVHTRLNVTALRPLSSRETSARTTASTLLHRQTVASGLSSTLRRDVR
jgi:serine/threonine protein kinase